MLLSNINVNRCPGVQLRKLFSKYSTPAGNQRGEKVMLAEKRGIDLRTDRSIACRHIKAIEPDAAHLHQANTQFMNLLIWEEQTDRSMACPQIIKESEPDAAHLHPANTQFVEFMNLSPWVGSHQRELACYHTNFSLSHSFFFFFFFFGVTFSRYIRFVQTVRPYCTNHDKICYIISWYRVWYTKSIQSYSTRLRASEWHQCSKLF